MQDDTFQSLGDQVASLSLADLEALDTIADRAVEAPEAKLLNFADALENSFAFGKRW
jgi:hypothetical protein